LDDAQMEIDRLIEEARREQNAAWHGPAFYSVTPLACDGPNEQCFSFRLAYADATPTTMRASLEEALTYHGCHLDKVSAAVVDGHLVCSAVSQQGKVAIKKARALLRRWQEWGHLTYITAYDRSAPVGPGTRHGRYNAARHGRVGA
jgi:hypothetical protein